MPSEVNVATDPLLVYGMVALFIGALVLALLFVRPRRGLGAVKRSDAPRTSADEPWMPGGDIFGNNPEPAPAPPPAAAPPPPAGADPWQSPPPVNPAPTGSPGASPDPWSTGTTGQPGPQPRWGKR